MQNVIKKDDIKIIADPRNNSKRYTYFNIGGPLFFAEAYNVNNEYKCKVYSMVYTPDEKIYRINELLEFQNNGNSDIDDYLRDCVYKFCMSKKPSDKLRDGYIFSYSLNNKKEAQLLERNVKLLVYNVNDCSFIDENQVIQHASRVWDYKKLFELNGRNCIIDDDYYNGLLLFKKYVESKLEEESFEKEKHNASYKLYNELKNKLNEK